MDVSQIALFIRVPSITAARHSESDMNLIAAEHFMIAFANKINFSLADD